MTGARPLTIRQHSDARGKLIALDREQNLPFSLQRMFFVYPDNESVTRGAHALSSQLLLIALRGSVSVECNNGESSQRWRLTEPTSALHIDAGVWLELSGFSADCILAAASPNLYSDVNYYAQPQNTEAIDVVFTK